MALPAILMLDTNMVSYAVRNDNPLLKEYLRNVPMRRLCISAVTEAELRYGLALKPTAKLLAREVEAFLVRTETLAWDSDAARHYATLRAQLKYAGTPLGSLDELIAAHALAVGATLVTNDKAFRYVEGLKTIDWTKP